ncbi:MAG: lipopolysaccharide biosynthesis protein [Planctomycetota bacterium]
MYRFSQTLRRRSISEKAENSSRIGLRPDTLASSIVILLAVNVVQRTIGFGRGVLFCRWLEPEELGHWEMAYSFLLLAAPLAVLGLPGSFGRYLVRYQEQGRVRLFLRRTASWTLGLSALTIGILLWQQHAVANLVFGDASQGPLVVLTVSCLAVVILHHFLEAVFAGLKLFRIVSAMHFCQSMFFAGSALALVACWRPDAGSVIVGYAIGCAVSASGTLLWSLISNGSATQPQSATEAISHREFWPPLMRFAIGVWVANFLCNLFAIIDRYMILHAGTFESSVALQQIGNYHAACIVPLLLVSVANLLVGAMTPHLSHEWEAGDRERVSQRLNLALQLVALAMLAAGSGVLVGCPWLFDLAFGDKYAAGLAVLPWTVASCVWFALLLVAQTYAWCAENTRAAAWPLAIGLVANVTLNFLWLPQWGLAGAVAATAVATLITLYAQLVVNQRLGMQVAWPTLAMGMSPLLLAGGAVVSLVGLGVLIAIASLQIFINQTPGWTSLGNFRAT